MKKKIILKIMLTAAIATTAMSASAATLPETSEIFKHLTETVPATVKDIAEAARDLPEPEPEPVEIAEPEPLTVEQMIEAECTEHGVDYRLALAIAKLETGHFTSAAYLSGNNVGGMSVKEVPISFSTLEEGVAAFVENLATYYAAGLTTPETIGQVYCPANDRWDETVRALME